MLNICAEGVFFVAKYCLQYDTPTLWTLNWLHPLSVFSRRSAPLLGSRDVHDDVAQSRRTSAVPSFMVLIKSPPAFVLRALFIFIATLHPPPCHTGQLACLENRLLIFSSIPV